MTKLAKVAVSVVALGLLTLPAGANPRANPHRHVELLPTAGSGVSGDVVMTRDGDVLRFRGEARGLTRKHQYLLQGHDLNGCADGGDLTYNQMAIGDFQPFGKHLRTVKATRLGTAFLPLAAYESLSVERVNYSSPEAANLTEVACGNVRH